MRKVDLMIIGAQKAGTTSLKNYLSEHPEILSHPQTEFGYFRSDQQYGNEFEKEFKRHFTVGNKNASRVVAKSVGIYSSETALRRLAVHNPDCKLVLILREPVSRSYSSYNMDYTRGIIKKDFSEIVKILEEREFKDPMYHLLIHLGLYAQFIEMVYKNFPPEQVRIYLYEKFALDAITVCKDVFTWINVDPQFQPKTMKIHNQGQRQFSSLFAKVLLQLRRETNPIKILAKSVLPYSLFSTIGSRLMQSNLRSDKMDCPDERTQEYLKRFFKPHNKKLERLTEIDLKHWYE